MRFFSSSSKPKGAPNAQVYDFTKIEVPQDSVDKEIFKDSPSSTLEAFYESPAEWVAKRRASRRLSLEVTKQPQQELIRSASAPFSAPYGAQTDIADELEFGKLNVGDSTDHYQTVKLEDSRWKGVMPSKAAVYDFLKVENGSDDLPYDHSVGEDSDWIKVNPEIRSGRRSMDVFTKAELAAATVKSEAHTWTEPGPDYDYGQDYSYENYSYNVTNYYGSYYFDPEKTENSLQDVNSVEGDTEWVKANPDIRSGRRSMDVFIKSTDSKHAPSNTWSGPSDLNIDLEAPNSINPSVNLGKPAYVSQSSASTGSAFIDSSSRFPDYVSSTLSSRRQKAASTSFPDYQ